LSPFAVTKRLFHVCRPLARFGEARPRLMQL
jgi:hypothetical protein